MRSNQSGLSEHVKALSATTACLPDFVEPMKAKLVGSIPSGNWIYEIKFDGYRALAFRGGSETRILSRNQKDLGGKFTEVKDSIDALDIQDATNAVGERSDLNRYAGSKIRAVQNARKVIQEGA